MTQVEIKMVLNTKEGQMNLNFFTSVEGFFSSEDDVMEKISSIMEKKVIENGVEVENGYGTAFYESEELFTMSFMKTNEGEIEKWSEMKAMSNQTVH